MKLLLLRLQGFYKYKNLFKQLVSRDIKLKYRRSILGYLWSVLNPLFVMLIMVIVFSNIFRSDVENFPLYLLSGQILFNYMTEATNGAMQSVMGASGLLKKIYVPKYIFTISKVTSTLITMILSLLALLIVAIATHAPVSWKYVLIVIPVTELYIFCLGLGMFLAQAAVFFRDIQYIYSVVLTGWMYMTPIFYPESILPEDFRFILRVNPMYHFLKDIRLCILNGISPEPSVYVQCMLMALGALLIGALVFRKSQDRFVLYL